MLYLPLTYDKPLFRPPSEANSLILQITNGCSWNKCAFCEMYTSKKFKIKPFEKISEEILNCVQTGYKFKKIFLADGDAMVLSTDKLNKILSEINSNLKHIRRISAYAKPKDLANKSLDELKELKANGLDLLYVGIESGDDELLRLVDKSETFKSTVDGLVKARSAGLKLSVMILNGLGGKELSKQHAVQSAKVLNEIQAEYASTLVLSMPYGSDHFLKRYKGKFTMQNKLELIHEMKIFLEHTELKQTVFRSDHASNYLILKGILSRDKDNLLKRIDNVLADPDKAKLREEWQRGL